MSLTKQGINFSTFETALTEQEKIWLSGVVNVALDVGVHSAAQKLCFKSKTPSCLGDRPPSQCRRMASYLTILFLIVFSFTLSYTLVTRENKIKLIKAKSPRPFFPESSNKYLTDYYTGAFTPNQLIGYNDLVVVMFYAPWNSRSADARHMFEVNARLFHSEIRFVAVNCFFPGGLCRTKYKLFNYPMIVAYSNNVHVVYRGPLATDHLYRWIVLLRNPLSLVRNGADVDRLAKQHHNLVIGFFPFNKMNAEEGYGAYAAAGMMWKSGMPDDETVSMCVVTDSSLAIDIGFRYRGEILMLRATDSTLHMPVAFRFDPTRITEWVNEGKNTEATMHWIYHDIHNELQTNFLSQLLNNSAVAILVTPHEPIYRAQNDIRLFKQIAEEYWSCTEESVMSSDNPSVPEFDFEHSWPEMQRADIDACKVATIDSWEVSECCRSLKAVLDWNMACSSGAKYRWEDEEHEKTEGKRRNHWVEQVLPLNQQCRKARTVSARSVTNFCCENYDHIHKPLLNDEQRVLEHDRLRYKASHDVRRCMRKKVIDYVKSNMTNSDVMPSDPVSTTSIRGLGCDALRNESLKFLVLDSRTQGYFVQRWGFTDDQSNMFLVIDAARDLFARMDQNISGTAVRDFITEYHKNDLFEYSMTEENSNSRFVTESVVDSDKNGAVKGEERIPRITQRNFDRIIQNSSIDRVVFFSGGNWHASSVVHAHVFHSLRQYFSSASSLITFYMVDTSKNDLPTNFNFENLPTVVIFPANSSDMSWKFPEALPITTPNLASFVRTYGSPAFRWRTYILSCNRICSKRNAQRLLRTEPHLLRQLSTIHRLHLDTDETFIRLLNELKLLRALRRILVLQAHGVSMEKAVDALTSSTHLVSYLGLQKRVLSFPIMV